jgi:drug/metabolite transporter (DMT)-like permease
MKFEKSRDNKKHWAGLAAVILSAVLFGAMPLLTKTIYSAGGNTLSAVFLRYAFASAVLFIAAKLRRVSLKLSGKALRETMIVSFLGYGSTAFLLYSSYQFIPSGMATLIHFVYPALVLVAEIVFFHERPYPIQILSLLLSLAGVALCFNGESRGSLAGILLAFLSGATYAFYILAVARSSLRSLEPLQLIFYLNLFGAVLSLALQTLLGGISWQMKTSGWIAAIALGILISVFAVFLFQAGIKQIGPGNAALLSTFEPLTSLFVSVVYFQEPFSARSVLGSAMILAAVILLARAPAKTDL